MGQERGESLVIGDRRTGATGAQVEYPVRVSRSEESAGLEPSRVYAGIHEDREDAFDGTPLWLLSFGKPPQLRCLRCRAPITRLSARY
jgi:hypothetical protein